LDTVREGNLFLFKYVAGVVELNEKSSAWYSLFVLTLIVYTNSAFLISRLVVWPKEVARAAIYAQESFPSPFPRDTSQRSPLDPLDIKGQLEHKPYDYESPTLKYEGPTLK
jgi:hypothetical protein